jgi:hypothetical protein
MDTRIPLLGTTPDIAGSYAAGQGLRQDQIDRERQNALAAFTQQNGAGIMQGDQNALAGLAGYDPAMAVHIQGAQLGQQATAQHAATMSAAERAADAEELRRVVDTLGFAWKQGPDAYARAGQAVSGMLPDGMQLPGYDDAPYAIGLLGGSLEALEGKSADLMNVPEGNSVIDKNNPGAGAVFKAEPLKGPDFDTERKFRDEFTGLRQVKEFSDQSMAMGRVIASADDPSAAGDMALIFGYMKLLDPGSTVREGEFATAEQAAGLPARIVNLYNKAYSGQRLGDDQRQDFVGRAVKLYQNAEQQVKALEEQYRGFASEEGLNPMRAIPNLGYVGELPQVGPKIIQDAPQVPEDPRTTPSRNFNAPTQAQPSVYYDPETDSLVPMK